MVEIFEIVPGLYQGSHQRHIPNYIQAVMNLDTRDAFYSTENLQYTHKPILDGPDPGEDWLNQTLAVLEGYRKAKLNTFIHCQAGMSRSVFVTAALLIREMGIDPKEAVSMIDCKSGFASPAPAFLLALKKLYEKTKG
jgi:protein-tyrosine phosphatase